MNAAAPRRGQPVLVLAMILGGWAAMRALLWTSPFPVLPTLTVPGGPFMAAVPETAPLAAPPAPREPGGMAPPGANEHPSWEAPQPLPAPWNVEPADRTPPLAWRADPPAIAAAEPPADAAPMRRIGGHYMLLAAGFSRMALPPEIAAFYARGAASAPAPQALAVADRPLLGAPMAAPAMARWSADGWLSWREGSNASVAPGAASYGRSQAGAVVRYRLAPGPLRPTAYARATHTLEGPRQAEFAAGIALRPLARVPVTLAAEGRVTDSAAGREVRPAVFAVTELPPADLPFGLRGEAYAQAGYVGGRDATAFADGQVRVDGRVARLGTDGEMRAGLGAWGGAQKGAARLDVGPSATLSFRLGEARSRVAVDYRLRVAGEAEPGSGPALTFSAGF